MSNAVTTFCHVRGETIDLGMRRLGDQPFDGTEVPACDVKTARNGSMVPPETTPSVLTISPVFVPTEGEQIAFWLFTISASESAALAEGKYITDIKLTLADGSVDYALPALIDLNERVTS